MEHRKVIEEKERLSITLTSEQLQKLEKIAEERSSSVASVIRTAVDLYLKIQG